MQLQNYPFDRLPFSKLFKTYVSDYSNLSEFYAANPFHGKALSEHADRITLPRDPQATAELIKKFNNRFNLDQAALQNIERLKDERALALVTGQQLGLFGGPLYTVLKTLTTIQLSRKLERQLGRPVVPVFWLADEDHDYDEVKRVNLLDRDEVQSYSLEYEREAWPPVADLKLDDSFDAFCENIEDELFDTDFTDELWELIKTCYTKGRRMDEAFGKLLARLFSKHGLVLAGSNCVPIKEKARACMQYAISHADEIRNALESQSSKIESNFHRQATIYDSNLFYLDEEAGRTKIFRNGTSWKTDSGKSWNTNELLDLIDEKPEQFSPNVFLRPILQDLMVPTLGYVAGPGELAYYGQMKKMYELFEQTMPAIIPRMSATIVEPAVDRVMGELPFEVAEYDQRIEDLESAYVEQSDQPDIEAMFSEWKEKVGEIAEANKSQVQDIDPTLEGAAGKTTAVYFGELDKLKGMVYRSVKQQEETQLKRIRKIKANLFPDGVLQERLISFIYFMNKYGVDIWDQLLEELDDDESFDQHKLIHF